MRRDDLRIHSGILIGAAAGLTVTLAVAAAIARLRGSRPSARTGEPVQAEAGGPIRESAGPTISEMASGAAAGALIAAADPRPTTRIGAVAGLALWAASCLGRSAGAVRCGSVRPERRNAARLGAHIVWGAATAFAVREIIVFRGSALASAEDEPPPEGRRPRS